MRRLVPVLLALIAAALLASTSGAAPVPDPFVFPVVGPYRYTNDFGDPRPQGRHEGNDILAPKKSPVVAVEDGKIKFWTTSARAGCMLYLYGASGTTYYYIHLNNDLTKHNDNRGKCVAGIAYARGLKSGAKVSAGQVIGYVGDSGDADGVHPHLHFELHPGGGRAVDPYRWLQNGQHLLFAAPRGMPFTLELRGTVLSTTPDGLRVRTASVGAWPMGERQSKLGLRLLVSVPSSATVQTVRKWGAPGTPTDLAGATRGQAVDLWTAAAPTTLKAERGDDLALNASLVSLLAR